MSLFHRISFAKVDPLGGGLDEEIAKEQQEPEAITSLDDVSEDELVKYWESVESDIQQDPEWFHFSEDE